MTAIFERVQKSFERQGMMQHLDARLVKVEHGLVELVLPYSDKVTQQQDGFHGGAMGAVADIAGGYAALTVTPEGSEVVTVEYKINFLGSFKGGELRATGRVLMEVLIGLILAVIYVLDREPVDQLLRGLPRTAGARPLRRA